MKYTGLHLLQKVGSRLKSGGKIRVNTWIKAWKKERNIVTGFVRIRRYMENGYTAVIQQ